MEKGKEVALWAGVAAFFGSVLAVGAFDLFGIDGLWEFAISIVVALFTGGAIYAKERLAFAKERENGIGHPPDDPPKPTQLPA